MSNNINVHVCEMCVGVGECGNMVFNVAMFFTRLALQARGNPLTCVVDHAGPDKAILVSFTWVRQTMLMSENSFSECGTNIISGAFSVTSYYRFLLLNGTGNF